MKIKKELSASRLFALVGKGFSQIKSHLTTAAEISLQDVLMSGFAVFSLKDSSLLAFDKRRQEPENLHSIYGIEQIPSDTYLRTVLDEVNPEALRPLYKTLFEHIRANGVLEPYLYLGNYYLLALDGSGYFSSHKINCPNCLEKHLRNGETLYHHQLLGAAIVHPDLKAVLPLMPEAIRKQDGATKNDCERNAAKRFCEHLRQDHPQLPLIVIEDALSSNAPHIQELQKHNLRFILGVKESDHAYLFAQVAAARQAGRSTQFEIEQTGITHRFHFVNQLALNASNPEGKVNFLEYWEITPKGEQYFSWVTDFTVTRDNAYELMRAGRARWKIENETFNTLKNQGYQFEHNFGHGQNHLSEVFALLMILAFLVDQVQQAACPLFQALLAKIGSKKQLWEKMRTLFATFALASMEMLYKALLFGYRIEKLIIFDDTA